jgi:protein TonB
MKKRDWLFKNPEVDLHLKFRRIFEASLVVTLLLFTIIFFSFKSFNKKPKSDGQIDIIIDIIDIPKTNYERKVPPPQQPGIPVASENEDFPEEITIPETEIDIFIPPAQLLTPPDLNEEEPVVPFADLSKKPEPIRKVKPDYPELARKAGISGTVVVKVLIGTDGNVEDVEVFKSLPMLDNAAVEAAKQFRFTPGMQRDRAVRVWMSIPFNFRLNK